MSKIGAKAFFLTEGNVRPDHHVVQNPDYFQKPYVRFPKKGITVTYGHKGPGSINRAALRKAQDEGLYLSFLDFNVDVGEWNPNKQTFESIQECLFLNLPVRASAPLMDDINEKWNRWLAQEGESESKFPRKLSHRMDLLDKLIECEPYNHLNAIAYDVETEFGVAKFLTIFNLDAIDRESISVIPGNVTTVEFRLPE